MRLIFAPDYDEATKSCAAVAQRIAESGTALLRDQASRGNLLREMKASNHTACFFMGHGSPESIAGQGGVDALQITDLAHLPVHRVFAYCCHSAAIGKHASDLEWHWWGYDNVMQPPPLGSIRRKDVETIFRLIAFSLHQCEDNRAVDSRLEELKFLCDNITEQYERAGEVSLSVSMFLRHIWSRLRVWLPNLERPLAHRDSFGGHLDWT